jgi:hypothetical protein
LEISHATRKKLVYIISSQRSIIFRKTKEANIENLRRFPLALLLICPSSFLGYLSCLSLDEGDREIKGGSDLRLWGIFFPFLFLLKSLNLGKVL